MHTNTNKDYFIKYLCYQKINKIICRGENRKFNTYKHNIVQINVKLIYKQYVRQI